MRALVMFNYFAVNLWMSGLHSYAGVQEVTVPLHCADDDTALRRKTAR